MLLKPRGTDSIMMRTAVEFLSASCTRNRLPKLPKPKFTSIPILDSNSNPQTYKSNLTWLRDKRGLTFSVGFTEKSHRNPTIQHHVQSFRDHWPSYHLSSTIWKHSFSSSTQISSAAVLPVCTEKNVRVLGGTVDQGGYLANAIKNLREQDSVNEVLHGEKISPSVLRVMLHELRRKRLRNRMVEVMEWASTKGLKSLQVKHFSIVISSCTSAGDLENAYKVFELMKSSGRQGDVVVYTDLIHGLSKAAPQLGMHALYKAIELLMEMQELGVSANQHTLVALLTACGRTGELEMAERLFEQEDKFGPPNTFAYTALIQANSENSNWERALELYEEMKDKNIGLTQFTCTAILSACRTGDQLEKALEIYKEMVECGIVGDTHTYTALISLFAKYGYYEKAMELFKEMKRVKSNPNTITYSALISACAKAGRSNEALSLFSEMQNMKLKPNELTMGALVHALTNVENPTYEDVARALGLLGWMEMEGIEPTQSIYSMLVEMCAKAGRVTEMQSLLSSALSSPLTSPSMLTFNSLLDILWTTKRRRDAANLLVLAHKHQVYDWEWESSGDKPARSSVPPASIDLHSLSVGAALTRTATWLLDLQRTIRDGGKLPNTLQIVTGKGLHSKTAAESSVGPVKSAVSTWLHSLHSPFRIDPSNEGVIVVSMADARPWISSLRKDVVLEQDETKDHDKDVESKFPLL